MIIDKPSAGQIPALMRLWKDVFCDTDEFISSFMETAFSVDRCRCATVDGETVAMLFWFDCYVCDSRMAYIYAVATDKNYRGQGICSSLMEATHRDLRKLGYRGAILVPSGESLFEFYEKFGYTSCTSVGKLVCTADKGGATVRSVGKEEYAMLRRALLPSGGAVQENENIEFLARQADLFAGEGFVLAARESGGKLYGIELLGDTKKAPQILKSLGQESGEFRIAKGDIPFAMFCPLCEGAVPPSYFGLAFD